MPWQCNVDCYSLIGAANIPLIHSHNSNISAAVIWSENETNACIHCLFHDESASACVVLYYHSANTLYNLFTLNITKLDRNQDEASGCIEFENQDAVADHIVVFAFSNEKEMIYGHPLSISSSPFANSEDSTSHPGISQ